MIRQELNGIYLILSRIDVLNEVTLNHPQAGLVKHCKLLSSITRYT